MSMEVGRKCRRSREILVEGLLIVTCIGSFCRLREAGVEDGRVGREVVILSGTLAKHTHLPPSIIRIGRLDSKVQTWRLVFLLGRGE